MHRRRPGPWSRVLPQGQARSRQPRHGSDGGLPASSRCIRPAAVPDSAVPHYGFPRDAQRCLQSSSASDSPTRRDAPDLGAIGGTGRRDRCDHAREAAADATGPASHPADGKESHRRPRCSSPKGAHREGCSITPASKTVSRVRINVDIGHQEYCEDCLSKEAVASGGRSSPLKKAAAMTRHQADIARWRHHGNVGEAVTLFAEEVLSGLLQVPVPVMMEATGLSESYCYRIRRGEVTPHPRHWQNLRSLTETYDLQSHLSDVN